MSNSYFRFKKFIIHQGQCAMKVTTDACILGAWAEMSGAKRILDIGTGTGLLALMIAQRHDAIIDAVELEPGAATQARHNFTDSIWADRLNLVQQDIKDFAQSSRQKYDLIISNPPFFDDSLKSNSSDKNLARHNESLSRRDLINIIAQKLTPHGTAFILLPEREANDMMNELPKDLLRSGGSLVIRNKDEGAILRKVVRIGFIDAIEKVKTSDTHLSIRDPQNNYTNEFIELLDPYYLYLLSKK